MVRHNQNKMNAHATARCELSISVTYAGSLHQQSTLTKEKWCRKSRVSYAWGAEQKSLLPNNLKVRNNFCLRAAAMCGIEDTLAEVVDPFSDPREPVSYEHSIDSLQWR